MNILSRRPATGKPIKFDIVRGQRPEYYQHNLFSGGKGNSGWMRDASLPKVKRAFLPESTNFQPLYDSELGVQGKQKRWPLLMSECFSINCFVCQAIRPALIYYVFSPRALLAHSVSFMLVHPVST